MKSFKAVFATLALVLVGSLVASRIVHGQAAQTQNATLTQVQPAGASVATTPIAATTAVNNQTTLTIPAPTVAGYYNYVCSLDFDASNDSTGTASSNATITSTNFNSWAFKYSAVATASTGYDKAFIWGNPTGGCVKSVSPGTATTFVSPSAQTHTAFTLSATYYQAP